MSSLFAIVVVVQVLSALAIIGLVLLQHGKGADMGAAFGSGSSGSLFGASGSSNFLSKSTGVAAAIFFGSTLTLSYIATNKHATVSGGVMDSAPAPMHAPAASKSASAAAVAGSSMASAPAAAAAPSAAMAASTGQSNQIPK
jgi:preprotein translocase subunit SecG